MAEGFVIRLIEPGWEQEATAAIVGPFVNGEEVAEALEGAGYSRSLPTEDPLEAAWGGTVEIVPLTEEIPPPR